MTQSEEAVVSVTDGSAGTPLVVVGVDGSAASKAALRWAGRYAAVTGARVLAVTAWEFPTAYGYAPDIAGVDFEADARAELDSAIKEVLPGGVAGGLDTSVVEGHPARALVDAAHGAELLVVGSRGLGGFSGLLLGSVSTHCVHHATCPVVVVRSEG